MLVGWCSSEAFAAAALDGFQLLLRVAMYARLLLRNITVGGEEGKGREVVGLEEPVPLAGGRRQDERRGGDHDGLDGQDGGSRCACCVAYNLLYLSSRCTPPILQPHPSCLSQHHRQQQTRKQGSVADGRQDQGLASGTAGRLSLSTSPSLLAIFASCIGEGGFRPPLDDVHTPVSGLGPEFQVARARVEPCLLHGGR